MQVRAIAFLLPALLAWPAPGSHAAGLAPGRHWQVSVLRIRCEDGGSPLVVDVKVRYLGAPGLAEAPLSELIDGQGRPHPPRSIAWGEGGRALAEWLSLGGVKKIQPGTLGAVQLKFELPEAAGGLALGFGDLRPVSLTRKGAWAREQLCQRLLPPQAIEAPRTPRPARVHDPRRAIRVYRAAYPCIPDPRRRGDLRTVEADHPPQLPRQLLVFGRGYLPNVRRIELPMGTAPAQSYPYAGSDALDDVEDAARRAIVADFPEYVGKLAARAGDGTLPDKRFFAFNWGTQRSPSGNRLESIGLYDMRPCAG